MKRHHASMGLRLAVFGALNYDLSLRDIEAITGIPHESVRRAIRAMQADGEVELVGLRRLPMGRPEAVYRVARSRAKAA